MNIYTGTCENLPRLQSHAHVPRIRSAHLQGIRYMYRVKYKQKSYRVKDTNTPAHTQNTQNYRVKEKKHTKPQNKHSTTHNTHKQAQSFLAGSWIKRSISLLDAALQGAQGHIFQSSACTKSWGRLQIASHCPKATYMYTYYLYV